MEQYRDSQYDDDLTIGTDEYDDSFQTSDIDLFEFGGDGETTISRLKTLVLSIDWEITDEVLEQFQEELTDLKDVWREDKINMVYLQALEKIGKYISREKADAHPNAIRLLLSMYYNLERIVLSTDLESGEKKRILLEDVRRFEKLKGLIGKQPKAEVVHEEEAPAVIDIAAGKIEELHALKAIVLGIDWEITDSDLLALREEVARLEGFYADSKPKQVFLQGIGTVGTYIRKMKSNAHADAFRLLHSFYEGLEALVSSPNLTLEEETEILKPEVKKFNAFKVLIATTLAKGGTRDLGEEEEEGEGPDYDGTTPVAPAFADMPEDSTHGFLEEVEAKSLPSAAPIDVDSHIDRFFGDADDTEAAPGAPAAVKQAGDAMASEVERASEAFFSDEGVEVPPAASVDRETALQGVEVETEADDDSDEEALPVLGGEVAPALVEEGMGETSEFAASEVEEPKEIIEELSEEIIDKLDSFFGLDTADAGPEIAEEQQAAFDIPAEVALQGVDVEHPDDVIEDEEGAVFSEVVAGADIDEEKGVEPTAEPEEEAEQVAALSDIEEPEESVPALAAALTDVDLEEVEEPYVEETMDEEEVEGRFDELFASLPDEEQEPAADLADDAMVEEEVAAFFTLDENPEELPGAEVAPVEEENLFDQEILGVREEEPVDFEIGEEEAAALAAEPVEDILESEPEIVVPLPADDAFGELRGCVQSVAVELNDDIIQGLFAEIGSLQEQFADKPLEKSFLQLITTVTRHIDQYRYEASDTSLGLLNGLMDDLAEASAMETGPAQQMLFTSMSRVLEWQQEQLARKSAPQQSLPEEAEEQPAEVTETPVEETVRAGIEEMMEAEIEAVDIAGRVHEDQGDRKVTDIIRREIEALRETLKQEIADLKKNLRGGQ